MKGSLKNDAAPTTSPPFIVDAALNKVPELDRNPVEDLILGCGQPAGEAGYNMARIVAILAGMPDVPGVTVNRYCSSSLQTIRMAAHAIKAGEGDVFVAAGVETVSRFMQRHGRRRPAQRRCSPTPRPAPPSAPGRRPGRLDARRGPARHLHRHGPDRRERGRVREASPARSMDEFAALSQQRATASLENGFWEHEITPVTTDAEGNAVIVTQDDGIRAGTTAEGLAELKPVFRPDGTVTAGNACPLNDGAAAVVVMSDTKAKELGLTPLARIVVVAASPASTPRSWASARSRPCRQALARAGMTIDDIDLVEINEAFAAQVDPVGQAPRHQLGQAQRQRRRHRPRPPLRHDRRPHHDHADQRPPGRRQDLRPRDRCASAAARAWP